MYGLDLFSGIGGLTKALEGYIEPVAYCESDRYAQAVLLSRMSTKDLPFAPIWDDVRTLRRDSLPIMPDIIYGGFPCQDISVAGRGEGLGGGPLGIILRDRPARWRNTTPLRLLGERISNHYSRSRTCCWRALPLTV